MQFLAHPRQQVMVLVLAVVVAIAAAYFMAQRHNASEAATTADVSSPAAVTTTTDPAAATTTTPAKVKAVKVTTAGKGATKARTIGGAVAVAKAKESKKDVSSTANAIESCAATLPSGGYIEGSTTCWAPETIRATEPTLAGPLNSGAISTSGTKDSYKVVGKQGAVTFTWDKLASGALKKTCAPKVKGVCTGTW